MLTTEALPTSVGPCDRGAAEAALRRFYDVLVFAGHPREIVWTRSPEEFGLMCAHHGRRGALVALLQERGGLGDRRPHGAFHSAFWDSLPDGLERVPLANPHFPSDSRAEIEGGEAEEEAAGDGEEPSEPDAVWSGEATFTQFGFPWSDGALAQSRAARAALGVLEQCAAFFAGLGVAVLCERPVFLDWDDAGRPHGESGPCMVYPSGWRAWAWRGHLVGEALHGRIRQGLSAREIAGLEDGGLRAELIGERGDAAFALELGAGLAEIGDRRLRRRLLKACGVEAFAARFGRVEHADDYGTLYRFELPGDEDLAVVKVVNATPEPGGSFRDYLIRVPPYIHEARDAVGWTFDIEEGRYYTPVSET
jgi:hypothetical protein